MFGLLAPPCRAGSRLRFSGFLLLGIAGLTAVPGDAVSSSVRRLVQHLAEFDVPVVSTWITPLRAHLFARFSRNAPSPVQTPSQSEKEVRPPDLTDAAPLPIIPADEAVPGSTPVQPSAPLATAEAPVIPVQPSPPPRPEPSALSPSPSPQAAAAEALGLVARGDELFALRDIASARLFYERAVEMGDGRAALRMGETFDPAFLGRFGNRGAKGDQQEALSWYSRAQKLGNAQADRLLKRLGAAR